MGPVIYSVFGIVGTIIGAGWLIIHLLTLFEKTIQGFFFFALLAMCVLITARALLMNFKNG